jgi:hypothetical protein
MQLDEQHTKRRLTQLRAERRETKALGKEIDQNAVEALFQEIVSIPEMVFTGSPRSKENSIELSDRSRKYPDFRFPNQNKVVEVIGTYSHLASDDGKLINQYRKVGFDALVFSETTIIKHPSEVRNEVHNFYGKCTECGNKLVSAGTEPPLCPSCGPLFT